MPSSCNDFQSSFRLLLSLYIRKIILEYHFRIQFQNPARINRFDLFSAIKVQYQLTQIFYGKYFQSFKYARLGPSSLGTGRYHGESVSGPPALQGIA